MSMISELIEELIDNADLYTKELHDLMYRAADTIEMLSEKAREPKQGEWIETDSPYIWKCSECPCEVVGNSLEQYNFCPNCGADMRGDKNNG